MSKRRIREICEAYVEEFIFKISPIEKCCFVVSSSLQTYLRWHIGLGTKVVEGEVELADSTWGHWWLAMENGEIIDATITQFKELKPKSLVYVGKLPKKYKILYTEL